MKIQHSQRPTKADDEDLIERAITVHIATPGAAQPAAELSTVEVGDSRRLVVLRNVNGVLSVYRVLRDGSLAQLACTPPRRAGAEEAFAS